MEDGDSADAPSIMDAGCGNTETVQLVTDLPPELLFLVCTHLPAREIARMCMSCRVAHGCCHERAYFLQRAERTLPFASAALAALAQNEVLEVLALAEFLTAALAPYAPSQYDPEYGIPSPAQVGFEFGGTMLDFDDGRESTVEHSQARIRVIAEALSRHASATAVIEAHVGPTAPGSVALSYSSQRGAVAAAILVWEHQIAVQRLRVRYWGKKLVRCAAESAHPNGDAPRSGNGWGELFIQCHGVEIPKRPGYYSEYDSGERSERHLPAELAGARLAGLVSQAAASVRARAAKLRRGALASPSDADSSDDDEEDEEEGEDGDEEEDDELDDGSNLSSEVEELDEERRALLEDSDPEPVD